MHKIRSHHFETMVEAIVRYDIYRGIESFRSFCTVVRTDIASIRSIDASQVVSKCPTEPKPHLSPKASSNPDMPRKSGGTLQIRPFVTLTSRNRFLAFLKASNRPAKAIWDYIIPRRTQLCPWKDSSFQTGAKGQWTKKGETKRYRVFTHPQVEVAFTPANMVRQPSQEHPLSTAHTHAIW